MAHPFIKIFDTALRKSTEDDNCITKEAVKLLDKGYSRKEICTVLTSLEKSLVQPEDESLVREAREEVCEDFEDS